MTASAPPLRRRAADAAGYSLVEMLIAVLVLTTVMGAAMTALTDAVRANEAVVHATALNNTLRSGMDLIVRDLLQTGSGLPTGHVIQIPSGGTATAMRRPGPPGTAYASAAGDLTVAAVIPGPGRGPTINGVATDTITILTADNNFTDVKLSAVSPTTVDVVASVNIGAGVDRVSPGQLMMVRKQSMTTLVQVTSIDAATRRLTFGSPDSLNLNQSAVGISGNLRAITLTAPTSPAAAAADATTITRVRMVSYYLDNTTSPGHPRLVRRINNGDHQTFNNTLGTAVALDVENLQFSYDLNNGANNPGNVRFVGNDLIADGTCGDSPCSPTQIRKVNVLLAARSSNSGVPRAKVYRNMLTSQVSLRGMAFVNEYQQ
jgi:type II secretory pathway pseudopilin PulG